ncbi:hypothetical protein PVE_P0329 (plasmid) [Pseudomonas veronii 1YdBTEX2]|uniref:Uncharacterized protein n=2 Tax=Pseudomonas veronii TaxID=76761 RepID=A0A7Y1ACC2_PSEVE|nr:hypothetical protein [Pseudomonas veronii]MBI6557391.1 hypothetical protein [Pseudomonas veronii]MBI6654091.1 hypothetical protein [Pseudomonas veronii]NMY13143.1 hypothetical protein [Pseudomonas veronii]SBW85368.1 hypothetical protein PVE_P0329 [Pseudomonas veronii 1YdBTEX2]
MKWLIGGQPLYTKNEFSFSNASVLCVGNSGKRSHYQMRSEHDNIGVIVPVELYLFEAKDLVGVFKVSRNAWVRFSDLLCL